MSRGASKAREGGPRWTAVPDAARLRRPPPLPWPAEQVMPPQVSAQAQALQQQALQQQALQQQTPQPLPPHIPRSSWPVYLPLPPPHLAHLATSAPVHQAPSQQLQPPTATAPSPPPSPQPPPPTPPRQPWPRLPPAGPPWPAPAPPPQPLHAKARSSRPAKAQTRQPPTADEPPPTPPPGTFAGAVLPVCGVEVLIVVVQPQIVADLREANLYVAAFHERFRRTIVLVAQDAHGLPYFYGPIELARVLSTLPFEVFPWRWLLYRTSPPPSWRLPISSDFDDLETSSFDSSATRIARDRRDQPGSK